MKRQQFFKLLLIFFYNKEKQMTHKIVPLVSWGNKKVTTIYNVNEIYWPYARLDNLFSYEMLLHRRA